MHLEKLSKIVTYFYWLPFFFFNFLLCWYLFVKFTCCQCPFFYIKQKKLMGLTHANKFLTIKNCLLIDWCLTPTLAVQKLSISLLIAGSFIVCLQLQCKNSWSIVLFIIKALFLLLIYLHVYMFYPPNHLKPVTYPWWYV